MSNATTRTARSATTAICSDPFETAPGAVSAPRFPQTLGLDVSDKLTHFCLLGQDGDILDEGRMRTREPDILHRTAAFAPCRVVLEVGQHSPWLSRLLRTQGHEVIVANPHKFALIRASYQKSDRSDAELLARAGRFDPVLLSPVVHRPEEEAADLAFLHARRQLVAARTSLINHVRGALKASGVMLPRWDAHAFHSHAPGSIPAQLAPALLPLVECIAQLSASIREMEKHARTLIEERYPQAKALQHVNGVGPITSLAFVLTLADPHRFNKSRLVGSYLGLTPRQRQSGERSPQLRITKAGDTFLRSLLVQSAHYILGPFGKDSDLRRWGLAHLERGGPNQKKRTVIAVARRLAVLLHHLLVSGEVYAPLFQQGGAAAA